VRSRTADRAKDNPPTSARRKETSSRTRGSSARTGHEQSGFRKFLASTGPGIVTGAADDDPAGIATYSIVGAQSGSHLLWTSLFTWPLMFGVQLLCARIGLATGQGLAAALKKKIPRAVLIVALVALTLANIVNIGADLSGMAEAAQMMTGIDRQWIAPLFAAGIIILTIEFNYVQIARVLKWLCLVLFAYVITAFMVVKDWPAILRDFVIPSWPRNPQDWSSIVAILGTTISPYLFFWQTSEEVEEEKCEGRQKEVARHGSSLADIKSRRLDVLVGTFFSNLIMFFIIVTSVATLHQQGITQVHSSREAADALKPLAGGFATTLYTMGLLGVGFLAIPTLASASGYALAETFRQRQGLSKHFGEARTFYLIIAVSVVLGAILSCAPVNPMRVLFFSSVVNGVLAPFLLVGIVLVARDRKLMNNQPVSRRLQILVWIAAAIMLAASVGMFVLGD
jgi:NRAMP (natural resistance-associated macrophage protein)-like metal ion transporter